jgi:hypothetical protein
MLQQNEQEEMLKFQENSKRKSQVLEHFLQEEHETLLEQYETLWETHQQMIVQHKQNVERLENQIDLLKKDSKDNTIKVHLEHVETQTRLKRFIWKDLFVSRLRQIQYKFLFSC